MVDGGQNNSGIETHLQTGNELFVSDPKGALAAFYQVVTLEPDHIEGWNQIGRLMFDMQQYSEAEMVFKRVETLAEQQGLPDWAEMAAQNVELAQQTAGEQTPPEVVEEVAEAVSTETEATAEAQAQPVDKDEVKSIEDISNIAAVAQIAATEDEALAAQAGLDIVVDEEGELASKVDLVETQIAAEPVEELAMKAALPDASLPDASLPDASLPGQPILDPQSLADPVVPLPEPEEATFAPTTSLMPEAPFIASAPAPEFAPVEQPLAPEETGLTGQESLTEVSAPVAQIEEPAPIAPPVEQGSTFEVQAPAMPPVEQASTFEVEAPPMPPVEQASTFEVEAPPMPPVEQASTFEVEAPAMPSVERASTFEVEAPPMPPVERASTFEVQAPAMPPVEQASTPFTPAAAGGPPPLPNPAFSPPPQAPTAHLPEQSNGQAANPMMALAQAGQMPVGQMPPQPVSGLLVPVSTTALPPRAEVAMKEPKSGAGKMALMITGIVGALGIGLGAAQYFDLTGSSANGSNANAIPVVKSNTRIASLEVGGRAEATSKPTSLSAPIDTSKDRAYKMGMKYLDEEEYDKARVYLEQADGAGHSKAGYNLASLYATGKGVEQDYKKAVVYLEKSSARGYYPAMTNLGLLYAQGQGVEQDYLKARDLWLKAAEGEHADAMHNLAVIYATGKGVDKDMEEAIKWYRKGANGGYVDSIANLGLIYANGDGVERDYGEAKRLWEMAAGKGHQIAAQNLERLKQVMAQ
ncbi:MAG: hypothetical protein L3J67_10770 [Hyphomicrobiaceae bacterium]|nr:hypothetical protein [Hyphomicrobiaceae bacterium]